MSDQKYTEDLQPDFANIARDTSSELASAMYEAKQWKSLAEQLKAQKDELLQKIAQTEDGS